ncbi:hypothetical protein O978_22165, partial [Mycobacterium avium subsp. paratuberculosis 10-5864]
PVRVASAATRTPARPASPSTRSASTAPASTEANWSGSPTRISRVSGRTASASRAIMVNDTIDVSSTTMMSCGSRLPRLCLNRTDVSGRGPSSRCSVVPVSPASRARSAGSRCSISAATASASRAAALPVGAASAILGRGSPARSACSTSRASSRATVVVLPVPGPPVSTVSAWDTAIRAAARCSS